MKYIIVDVDGTITDASPRSKKYLIDSNPKNWDAYFNACDEDKPIQPICDLVKNLSDKYQIVFITGRRNSTRVKTEHWIDENIGISDYTVYMRKDNDFRHDLEVKPELLNKFFAQFNAKPEDIAFFIEDRNCMVQKWRDLDYTVLQPAVGDF